MDKNKVPHKVQCQNTVLQKRLIVDDRNKNWKARKSFDLVTEQQTYELSQIPFEKKLHYAARYFKDHCHDCYCRDPLVSPTSKYLQQDDSSDYEEDDVRCTCPLEHACNLRCSSSRTRDKSLKESNENFAPFLKSKKNQYSHKSSKSMRRRRHASSCSDTSSSYDRRKHEKYNHEFDSSTYFNNSEKSFGPHNIKSPVSTSCSDKCNCVCESDLEPAKTYLKNRKKVIKTRAIITKNDFKDRRSYVHCSGDTKCSQGNSKLHDKSYTSDVSAEAGLSYTKQRQKYEQHNIPRRSCVRRKCKNRRDKSIDETHMNKKLDLSDVSEFRDKFYFDTHDPFTKTLPQNTEHSPRHTSITTGTSIRRPHSVGLKSIEIDRFIEGSGSGLYRKDSCHKCVYSFELNSRLQPMPLNEDIYGRSCCDECGKPMKTMRRDGDDNSAKEKNNNDSVQEVGVNCKIGTTCTSGCKGVTASQCSKQCPSALEPQRVHIGCGNERIKLIVPSELLEDENIGHSIEVTSKGNPSIGSKSKQSGGTVQRGKGSAVPGKTSWNSDNREKVNPAERPNSFALKQQKFSMYKRK